MESYVDLGNLCHAVDPGNQTEIQDEVASDVFSIGSHHPAASPSYKGRSVPIRTSENLNGLLSNCTSLTTVAMATIASTAGAFAEDLWKPAVGVSAVINENDTLGSLELFFPMMQDEDSVFYLDLRLDPENIDQGKGSYGLGVRQIVDGDLLIGGYAFYNNERVDGNDFKGLSIGAEAITAKWDVSINAHIPISGDVSIGAATSGGVVSLVGNQLLLQSNSKARRALMGADAEIGRRIKDAFGNGKSLRFSAAGYHYQNTQGADFEITGGRVGFDFEFKDPNDAYSPSLTFGGSVSRDNFYNTQFAGHVRLTIPLGGGDAKSSAYGLELDGSENSVSRSLVISEDLLDRVNTPIRSRGLGIISAETGVTTSSAIINPATGQPFGAFTFADDANSAGAGTFADPTTLNAAITNAGANGFVVALENGLAANINSAGETLQDNQTLIGGGSTIKIQVDGALTTFTLPGAAGTIEGTGANSAINLANANIIRDVTLTGGGGIAGNGITDGLFNNVAISAAGGLGVSIVNGAGTFAFNNVDISNSGGVGVDITGGAANFVFDAASSVTHNSTAHDPAIRISAQTGGGVVFNGDVTVTASAGIEISSSAGDVSFNGNTTITNPTSDAISLNGANGAVTFANVNLTNLSQRGIEIIGATNNVTVNGGTINNANAGYGVTIQSQASTSTITFNNLDVTSDPSGADVLNIQNSAGNIDVVGGTFTANSPNDIVDIDNGSATINIGATLIDNGSGNGIEIDGITGGAITFSGNYTRNGVGEAVNIGAISALTGGAIVFNGTVTATGGSNIVINNSAAAINFNANVTVTNPTADAIDFSDSTGNVTFVSVDIDGGVQGIDLDDNTGTFTLNGGTIDGTTGDAINVLNAPISINNVTIGTNSAIGGDGIVLSNTDGTSRTSILNGNTIGSVTTDIAGRGVVVESTGTGTATVNFVGNNSIRSTSAALEATATNTNTLVMALDNITAERGTAGFTFDIQGASHAALTTPIVVTSLNAFTLVANGTNGGALFNNVAFDADGLSGGAVTQVTATGSTNIGQGVGATQRVQGDGLSFLSPVGNINFSTLNIFNNGGTGLEVDTKTAAPTTTFNLDVSAGGVNTTTGAALFLDPLTGDLTFDSITGSGSASAGATSSGASGNGNAITIDGFIGSLTSGSTTITDLAAGETGVSFTNNTAGTNVNLGTTSISSTANNVTGLDLQNTNGETITIGAGSSINLTGTGTVGVDLSAAGTNANFTFGDGTAPPSSTIIAETPIDFTGMGANGTYNFLDVDFTNVNLGVGVGQNDVHYFAQTAQGLGDGSSAANASNTTVADAVATANTTFIAVGGGTIDLDTNGDGTFNLAANQDLATFASVGASLNVSLTGIPANVLLNLTAGVVTDGNATGRTALTTSKSFAGDVVVLSENNQLTNVEINNNGLNAIAGVFAFGNIGTSVFTNVDISGALIGLDLANTSGTLTVDANSSINNSTVFAYREQTGTAIVAFNGTINATDGVGAGVDITGKTAGATSFAGMVTANSSSQNAINLTNNLGSTINFTGGLDIDTTNGIGFNATGGGTVSVANAGAETINTAGTGQALVINGMTIGAGGVNFDNVTTAATTTGNAVEITDAAGGAVTVTSVNLAGVAGAAGLRVSGDTRTSNVNIGGGTIASGVSIVDDGSGTVQIDANITDNAGHAFQVANRDGVAGAVTVNGTITNSTGAVSLQSNTAGDVTFNGIVTGTGSNNAGAIDVDNVTGGTNTFAALVDIDVTGAGAGIDLTNNLSGAFNFTGGLDIDTVTGTGFNATGNGTIHITSPGGATGATVTSTAGTAINISGMSIAAGGVQFGNIASTGGANGISLQNFSGGTFSIANGSTVDIQNSSGAGLIISNPFADVNFGPGVTTTVKNSTQGIQVLGGVASSDVLLSNIVVDGSTGSGLALVANSGTVTITGGSVGATTNNGSGALQINGGNGTLTVGASLTQTSSVHSVNITGRSGGTITISGDVTSSGANTGVRLQNNSGGTVDFSGQLDLDMTGNGIGVQIANTNAGLTTNFTGGVDINSVNGTGFEALSGAVNVSATAMTEQITTSNGQAVNLNGATSNITFDSISSTNSAGAGIRLDTIAGSFAVSGLTTITDATGDGISLTSNVGTITFGATNIDLGATVATAGIDIEGVNGQITFGATTVTDIKTGQTGIDFTGADTPANFGITAISGPVNSAGTGIDLSSTQNNRAINFATGSSVTFTGTGASTGVQLAASDLVATTANANFTFGDGSFPTGSTISVGASGVTVDTIGLSAASGAYNFVDVAFTGNADVVTTGAPTFVSQAGGVLSVGTFGLSNQITTIDVATAEAQADTNQTFTFVGNNLDFTAEGGDGFTLDDGQNVDGFANGNSVSFGSVVPVNVSGIAGGLLNVTANDTQITNSGGNTVFTIGGSSTIENIVIDGSGAASGDLFDISGAGTVIVQNTTIQNDTSGTVFDINSHSGTVTIQNNTINVASELLDATGGAGNITVTRGTGTAFTARNIRVVGKSGGSVIASGDLTLNGGSTTAIQLNNNNNTTITFNDQVDINNTSGIGVFIVSNNAASAFNFLGGLDITTTNGTALNAINGGTLTIANAGTEQITTTGTGGAIALLNIIAGAGGINFDQVTTGVTSTATSIAIDETTGGAINIASANLNGTAGTTGLDISGDARTSNVIVSGGTINSGMLISDNGSGTVQIDANISDNAGYAFQVANRGAGAGAITVNGTVTNAFGAVSLQSNSAGDVTFNGVVTGTGANTSGAIDIDNVSGGTNTFAALVDIDLTGNGTGVQIGNTNAGGTFDFAGGLDINSVNGVGFEALSGTVSVANAGVEQVITTGTAGAINLDSMIVGAGGINFDQVTTAVTSTSNSINIDTTTGGAVNIASANLNGTSYGLLVSDANTAVNVNAGTINNGVSIVRGGNAVTIGANITKATGAALGIIRRNTASAITINGNITSSATAVNVFQSGGALLNVNGTVAGTGTDATGSIDLSENGGGSVITFANQVTLNMTGSGAGVHQDTINGGADVRFTGGLDITTVDGTGLEFLDGVLTISNAAIEQIITTGTGRAINLDTVTVAAGGVNFDQVTTSAATASAAVRIDDVTGGAITLTSVDLDGIVGTTGLDIGGSLRSANVIVSGGTIASGVGVSDSGTGAVQIDANVSDNAGYAFQVANRGASAGAVTVNGTVTNNTGAVSLQSNSAGDITFNGIVTGTGANTAGAIDIDNVTGGTVTFAALVDIDVTGNGTGVSIGNTNAGGTFNFNAGLDINSVNGTGFEALSGTVNVAATTGVESVTTTNGQAVNLNSMTSGIAFDSLSSTNSTVAGITLNTVAGSFTVSGTTTVTDAAGDGISLTSDAGTVTFGATTINLGATAATAGIDIEGTNGDITFGDVDITDVKANQTGFDVSGGTVDALILANTLDITGVGAAATGARGIDLTGYDNSKNFTNTASGTIVGVQFGVDLTNSNIANSVRFQYGDGAAPVASVINTSAVAGNFAIVLTGATATGEYDFEDVVFATSNMSNLTGGASFFVFDEEGTAGAGTFVDPGTAAQAAAASVDVLVAVDNSGFVGNTIVLSDAGQGAINTLVLDDNQALIGLIAGQSIDASTLGLGLAGGAPANLLLTGVGGSTVITGSGVAAGVTPSVATTGANNAIELTGTGAIQSIYIDNLGTGDAINASFASAETVTIRSATIITSGGDAIDISTTAGASTVILEANEINGSLRLNGAGGGTLAANTVGAANTINAYAVAAVDISAVTTNLSFASITGNGAGTTSFGINLNSLGANSIFTVTGTTTLDNYTNADLNIGSISADDVTINFEAVNIRTAAGGLAQGGFSEFQVANVSGANLDINVGDLTIGNAGHASDIGIRLISISGANTTIDLASYTSTRAGQSTEIVGFNSAGGGLTVAGTTNITDARTHGIRMYGSSSDATFLGNTTITNSTGFNGSGVVLGVGGANTGTYSFAGLDVSVTGAGAFGLQATNSGTLNITGGTNNITSNNGTAVLINPTVVNATFQSLTSSNSSGNGVDLTLATGSNFTVTGSTNVNSSTGNAVNIVGQAGTQTVSLGTLNINNGGSAGAGLAVSNATAGTLTVNSNTGSITTGNNTAVSISNAVTGITLSTITGNGVGTVAQGVLLDNLGSSSSFMVSGTTQLGRYTGDQIAITNLAKNTQTINFGTTNLNAFVSGASVAASTGLRIENITATDVNIDFGNTLAGQVALTARGILVKDVNASAANFDLDFARLQLDRNGIGVEFDNYDSGTATVAGTTAIIRSVTDSIKITNSAGNVTFADTTTIINNAAGFDGNGVDIGTSAGGANTGAYSFAGLTVNTIGTGAFGLRATDSGTLNITGGTNNITSSNGTAVLINPTITNITLQNITSSNSTDHGISLDLAGAGSTFTVTGTTNITSSANAGIDISNSEGTVSFGATNILNTATAGGGVALSANPTAITNFTGTLDIDTNSGVGFEFTNGGTLNAADAGNSIQTVTGQVFEGSNGSIGDSGVTFASMGASGTILNASGISLNNIDGVGNTFSGGAVTIAGTSAFGNDGIAINGGSDATFTFASATIDNVGGAGLDLDGANGAITFTTVDIDGTGLDGVDIDDATNVVNIDGGTIGSTSNATYIAVDIDYGSADINIAADITKTNAINIVSIFGRTGGAVELSGNISATGGLSNGISIQSNTGGTTTFSGNVEIDTGASTALYVTNSAAHAITFSGTNTDIDATSGGGVLAQGGATINFNSAGTNTINTTTGRTFSADVGGTVVIGGTANLASTSGTVINANGVALNATFASANTTTSASTDAINLTNTTGSLTINGGTTTVVGSGQAFHINGGSVSVSSAQNVVSTGATTSTVRVQNATGGTNTFSGNFTDASGTSGGTYDFIGNTGGSTTFTGDVRIDSGNNNSIYLSNSAAHAVSFNGTNTDIDNLSGVNSRGLVINGGGTINFNSTGTNTLNIIGSGMGIDVGSGGTVVIGGTLNVTTATGTAVDISGTTIGAAGVTFRSVSKNGGANGIVLNGTGTAGAFTITGTGTTDGSGGTIQNTTGNAIQITNASNIDLRNMNLTNVASSDDTGTTVFGGNIADYYAGLKLTNVNSVSLNNVDINGGETAAANGNLGQVGISGQTVSDLTITDSIVENFGNTSGEDNIQFQGLTGTVTVNNLLSRDSGGDLFAIDNTGSGGTTAGGNLTMTVTGSTFDETVNGVGAGGLRLSVNGAGTTSVSVNTSTFGNGNVALTNGGLQGTGLQLNVGRGHVGTLTAEDNTFQGMNIGISATLDSAGAGAGPQLTANIRDGADGGFVGNTITRIRSNAINLFTNGSLNPGEGQLTATISGNVIGTLGTLGSGSFLGSGIQIGNEGGSSVTALIDGNTIQEVANFEGIIVSNNVSAGANNVTITNNTFAEINFDRPIQVEQTIVGGTTCSNISGNSFSGTIDGGPFSSASDIIRVRQTAGIHNSTQTSAANIQTVNGGVGIVTDTGTINFSLPACILP